MKQAMVSGIRLVACTMSMDVMGITKEELIDGGGIRWGSLLPGGC